VSFLLSFAAEFLYNNHKMINIHKKRVVMRIKACHFGIAGAATFCSLYTIFACALKFFPNQTLKFIGTIHMMPKLEYIKPFITVTPQAIAIGLVSHTIIVFIFFCAMAMIYNLFQE
jgi:hypothetical protein